MNMMEGRGRAKSFYKKSFDKKSKSLPLGFLSHFRSIQVARAPGFTVFLLQKKNHVSQNQLLFIYFKKR